MLGRNWKSYSRCLGQCGYI